MLLFFLFNEENSIKKRPQEGVHSIPLTLIMKYYEVYCAKIRQMFHTNPFKSSTYPVGVDSSLAALELARENIVLNNMDQKKISFMREDAIEFMKSALSSNEIWDIIILDPPKLAPRKKVKILREGRQLYIRRIPQT